MSGGITVSGGADGIEARFADLRAAGELFAAAARDTTALVWLLLRQARSLPLATAAAVDPVSAARFDAAMTAALGGPRGIAGVADRLGSLAGLVRLAAWHYELADSPVDRLLGPLLQAVASLPRAQLLADTTLVTTADPLASAQASVTSVPGLTGLLGDALVLARAGPLFVGPLLVTGSSVVDGRPRVRARGVDQRADAAGPPRSFADLMAGLARRNHGAHGEIGITRLTGADGTVSWVVDITGTKSWTPLPTSDVTSLATNTRALAGWSTSYERGVLDAMASAGVHPSDRVMLVGHSQGGMVAANAAVACASSGRFRVTNVVTAGAPIGPVAGHIPPQVQVLALENEADVVPRVDGVDNPPAPNVTTVTVRHDHRTVGGNHGIEAAYLPGAADVDASANASIRAFRDSAAPFLQASASTTSVYVVTRGY